MHQASECVSVVTTAERERISQRLSMRCVPFAPTRVGALFLYGLFAWLRDGLQFTTQIPQLLLYLLPQGWQLLACLILCLQAKLNAVLVGAVGIGWQGGWQTKGLDIGVVLFDLLHQTGDVGFWQLVHPRTDAFIAHLVV